MIAVCKAVLGGSFLSIGDMSFSNGSIVVNSSFTLSTPASAAELNSIAQSLISSFYTQYNMTLENNVLFVPSPPSPGEFIWINIIIFYQQHTHQRTYTSLFSVSRRSGNCK